MMISLETHAEIRRLYYAEHLTINMICEQLNLHQDTVKDAIESKRFQNNSARQRESVLDSFMPLVREKLEAYPKMRASRLLQILQDRGYTGSVRTLRRRICNIRPRHQKAYLSVQHMPGEQGQVDWGSFGTLMIGRAQRRLSCFLLTLPYSGYVYARFTLDQTTESFVRCHVDAFQIIDGVPRSILFDNLKSCVLERLGNTFRFHPEMLKLQSHYHFIAKPCNVRAGWEKGSVERSVRFIRDSFFAGRQFRDLDDANQQLRCWLDTVANCRPWPKDRTRSVSELFKEDQSSLLPIKQGPLMCCHTQPIRSGKTPYVRFDLNDYSIPYKLVRRQLTLLADEKTVRIIDGGTEVARHQRCYDRAQRIENHDHVAGLLQERKKATVPRGRERIIQNVPEADALFKLLADRGFIMSGNVTKLIKLMDHYGVERFKEAVIEAVRRKTPRSADVESILSRMTQERKEKPRTAFNLPDDPRVQNQSFPPRSLSQYDRLSKKGVDNEIQ